MDDNVLFIDEEPRTPDKEIQTPDIDKLLPPDPEAILEVRHLKKHFVLLQQTI